MPTYVPTLVIVGRPNVGKSTIFNRIVGKRIAVVEDSPGITRDRLYTEFEHEGRKFRLVDTGGILFGDEDPLTEQIRIQAEVALSEANVILFVVDAMEGLTAPDWDLAERLRGVKQPVYIVANKADNTDLADQANEFYALGIGEVRPVSGIHGRGFDSLLSDIAKGFPKSGKTDERQETKIAIVGRPNVGKSSMLNAFTGEERAIVSNIPGTTRDAVDTLIEWKGNSVRLIDTAGIRRKGKIQGSVEYYMVHRAETAIQRADCALLIVDGQEGLTDGDKRVAKSSHDMGKPLVVAINKWDLVEPPDGELGRDTPIKKEFRRQFFNEIPEVGYATVLFASAKEARGMDGIAKAAFRAVENWSFRVSTGTLNRIVQDAVFDKPLTRKGRPLRVYYCTQPSTCPPTFVLFCNDANLVHFSYQRYIENVLRKEFPLTGTPIKLVVRSSRGKGE